MSSNPLLASALTAPRPGSAVAPGPRRLGRCLHACRRAGAVLLALAAVAALAQSPSITTLSIPSPWTVGAAYSTVIASTGGTAPRTIVQAAGSTLPDGLSLAVGTGTLSGTPTTPGSYTFSLVAKDHAGAVSLPRAFSLVVTRLTLATASALECTIGKPYSQTIVATGGTGTRTFAVTAGSLPLGLSLSSAGGLSGTPQNVETKTFTIQVTDSLLVTATRQFTLTINPLPGFSSNALGNWTVNQSGYHKQPNVTGGTAPLTFAQTAGTLPTGLSLDPASGFVTGTPTVAGAFNFTLQVTDNAGAVATHAYSVTINPQLAFSAPTTFTATAGTALSGFALATTGGTGTKTFTLVAHSLPPGVSLSGGGVFSGTPTLPGNYDFTVSVQDTPGATATAFIHFTINQPFVFATTSLPDWVLGANGYSASFTTIGGTGSSTYARTSGSLPHGMTLSSTGVIGGVPDTLGTSTFTVTAQDQAGATVSASFSITIVSKVSITATAFQPWTANAPNYDAIVSTTGGIGGKSFSIFSGTVPPGLVLSSTGHLSGTPTTSGTYSFTVRVVDDSGLENRQAFSLLINPALQIATATLAEWTRNYPGYNQPLNVSGGTGVASFALASGSLPPGLTMSGGRSIAGTPTTAGAYPITLTATDAVGATVSVSYTLTINPVVATTAAKALPPWTVFQPGYSQMLPAGGTGAKTYHPVALINIPNLGLDGAGVLSGTPTSIGTFQFDVDVTDSIGATGRQTYTLTINPPPELNAQTLPPWTKDASGYTVQITADGGTAPLTFVKTSGSLPPGLTLATIPQNTAQISGRPTASGVYGFTLQVTDAAGASKARSYSIKINDVLAVAVESAPMGEVGIPYSASVAAVSGTGTVPITYSAAAGALPSWLTLDPATGALTGTPPGQHVYSITITATDSVHTTAAVTVPITINRRLALTTTTLARGVKETAYSQTLQAVDGVEPRTFSTTSALPSGMSLDSAGHLTGTPHVAGTFTIVVKVTDALGATDSRSLDLILDPPLAFPATLPQWTVNGSPYGATLVATGGLGSYTFTGSDLPAGLTLSNNGVVSGNLTASGAFSFPVTVTDGIQTVTHNVSLTVAQPPLISPTVLTRASVGSRYLGLASVTRGTPPYQMSIEDYQNGGTGLVAPEVNTDFKDFEVRGMATHSGVLSFRAVVVDAAGVSVSALCSVPVGTGGTISITTLELPDWTVGASYSQPIATNGGLGVTLFTVFSGALPPGLDLSNGTIAGVPTTAGTYSFQVRVADSNSSDIQPYTIVINPAPRILPVTLPGGTVSGLYAESAYVDLGTAPYVSLVVTDFNDGGTGLAAPSVDLSTGRATFGSTPTAPGRATFTVSATDAAGATASRFYSVNLSVGLSIATTTLPNWTVNTAGYSQTLTASGAMGTTAYAVTAGTLPTGLTLVSSTGVLSGTPVAAGTFDFTITVTDGSGASAVRPYTVVINPALSIAPATLAGGAPGAAYAQTATISGGTTPYAGLTVTGFNAGGTGLPTPVTNVAAGTVSLAGTPTASGTVRFTVNVTDATGATLSKAYSVTILPPLNIDTLLLADWTAGQPGYHQVVATTGGAGATTFGVTAGALPTGLSLNSASGAIDGTPTTASSFDFTITASDAAGTTRTQSYTVIINPALAIAPATLPAGAVGVTYQQQIAVTGGTAPDATFAVTAFDAGTTGLPTPVVNASARTITIGGLPSAAGVASFTVTVVDATGAALTRSYAVNVLGTVAITTSALADWTQNAPGYNQTLAVAGGFGPKTFAVTGGNLPNGLTLNGNGALTGTPTIAGSFNFTVTATDALGSLGSRAFTIVINPPPTITPATLSNGTAGVAYNQVILVTGGTAPLTSLTVTGFSTGTTGLPAPAANAGAGTITWSGTPAAGTATFTVNAVDAAGAAASRTYSINVLTTLAITTTELTHGTVFQSGYNQTIATTGATTGITFSVTAGRLPPGLILNSATGVVSGTPGAAGTFSVTIGASAATGGSDSRAFSLIVDKAAATVALDGLTAVYTGAPHAATATTTPPGLVVNLTYDGGLLPPTDAGPHGVNATIVDLNYAGTTVATMTISPASVAVRLDGIRLAYDGTPRVVAPVTDPEGVTVAVTYNGGPTPPILPGAYALAATVSDPNYTGSATGSLTVGTTALLRHAPSIASGIDGSVQVVSGENVTLGGAAYVSGDLLVPGTPAVTVSPTALYVGTIDAAGAEAPSGYTVALNNTAVLRNIVRRVDPIPLPTVAAPPAATGTRNVTLSAAGQSAGDFATVRNLTITSNAGAVAMLPGTYGALSVSGNTSVVLGVAGATEPAIYNLQSLSLNVLPGAAQLQLVGPVVITIASGAVFNGNSGAVDHPEWLLIRVASGGLTSTGSVTLHGSIVAPNGTVTLGGAAVVNGTVVADRLVLNQTTLLNDPNL